MPQRILFGYLLEPFSPLAKIAMRALASIATLLFAMPTCLAAQSSAPGSAPGVSPESSALLQHVIANEKKDEEALEVYERIERLETRKNANDPAPTSIKVTRVI